MERGEFVKVRVTPSEHQAIETRARGLGTAVSDLSRRVATGVVTVRAIDSAAAFELRRLGAMLKSLQQSGQTSAGAQRGAESALRTLHR